MRLFLSVFFFMFLLVSPFPQMILSSDARGITFPLSVKYSHLLLLCSSFLQWLSSLSFAWQPEALPASWNKITTLDFIFISFHSVCMQLHPKQDGFRFPKQHFIGQSLKLLLFHFQCSTRTHTLTHSLTYRHLVQIIKKSTRARWSKIKTNRNQIGENFQKRLK